jgi:3-oxoacyl-[acyl-carrier protein] reductase
MGDRLKGKVAIVTGAGRGLGRAEALLLASEGAKVVVNDLGGSRDGTGGAASPADAVVKEIKDKGGEAVANYDSVATTEGGENIINTAVKTFGRLDILVNNAGILKDQLVPAMSLLDWDRVMHLNLRGAFLATRLAVEWMLPRHCGKIINIASVSAVKGGRGQANYAAAKGGLVAFTRACATELAAKGIQVNAVLPGMIITDMSSRIRKRAGEDLLSIIPAGRFGNPDEVAHLVVFLASSQADYINGQAIAIDGGMSIA